MIYFLLIFPIDVWSAGCVLAELLLGQPIFPGDSGVDQLVEIIKVLGTPTRDQIREMNPNYTEFKFPQIKSHPWQKVKFPVLLANNFTILLRIRHIVFKHTHTHIHPQQYFPNTSFYFVIVSCFTHMSIILWLKTRYK